jgi:hypothetical protein
VAEKETAPTKSDTVEEQVINIKDTQVARLAELIRQATELQNLAQAAGNSGNAYVQAIADERGISGYVDISLDADKKQLTFHFKERPRK